MGSEMCIRDRTRTIPEDIPAAFVKALQDVFSGLEKVTIRIEDLKRELMESGSPCTVEDLSLIHI